MKPSPFPLNYNYAFDVFIKNIVILVNVFDDYGTIIIIVNDYFFYLDRFYNEFQKQTFGFFPHFCDRNLLNIFFVSPVILEYYSNVPRVLFCVVDSIFF